MKGVRTARGSGLAHRARGEYLEMPGLSLTLEQAQRLWAVDRSTCARLLSGLVQDGFLRVRPDGAYVRERPRPAAQGIGG